MAICDSSAQPASPFNYFDVFVIGPARFRQGHRLLQHAACQNWCLDERWCFKTIIIFPLRHALLISAQGKSPARRQTATRYLAANAGSKKATGANDTRLEICLTGDGCSGTTCSLKKRGAAQATTPRRRPKKPCAADQRVWADPWTNRRRPNGTGQRYFPLGPPMERARGPPSA